MKKEEMFMERAAALLKSGKYEKALRGKQVAVIGVGGAGGNIVEYMARNGLKEMEGAVSIVINSDERMLTFCTSAEKKVLMGKNIDPHPKGAGGSRRVARKMVDSAKESLEVLIDSYPVIVLTGALGGGTGTELMLELSAMSMRMGKLALAIPVLPFSIEGPRRRVAESALKELRATGVRVVEMDNDSLLKPELMGLPNERAFAILNRIILSKVGEIHASARRALIDEIVNDIMKQLPAEESAVSSEAVPERSTSEERIAIPVGIGPEPLTAENPGEVFEAVADRDTIPPAQ